MRSLVLVLVFAVGACASPSGGGGSDTGDLEAQQLGTPDDSGVTCSSVGNVILVTVASSTVESIAEASASWRLAGDSADPVACLPSNGATNPFRCADGEVDGDYEIIASAAEHEPASQVVTLDGEPCEGDQEVLTVVLEALSTPTAR